MKWIDEIEKEVAEAFQDDLGFVKVFPSDIQDLITAVRVMEKSLIYLEKLCEAGNVDFPFSAEDGLHPSDALQEVENIRE